MTEHTPTSQAGSAAAEDKHLDARGAAAILQEARARAVHELRASYPVILSAWGLALLLGYGVIWLSVRGQHPYTGPTPTSLLVLTLLVAAAAVTTVIVAGRALTGIGGVAAVQRRVHYLALVVGYAGIFALEGALAHAGASDSLLGVYGAVAPMLVTGVVVAASPAVWQNWSTRGLGAWLAIVAASAGYAGPAGVWGVAGLAAGVGFFVVAALQRGRARA